MASRTFACQRYISNYDEIGKSDFHITNHVCVNHSACRDLSDESNADSRGTEKSSIK